MFFFGFSTFFPKLIGFFNISSFGCFIDFGSFKIVFNLTQVAFLGGFLFFLVVFVRFSSFGGICLIVRLTLFCFVFG